MNIHAIERIFDSYSKKVTAKLGLGFMCLETGEELYLNGDDYFPAASTYKVPLLITLFEQAAMGNLSLDEMYTLKEEDYAVGGGVLCTLTPGVTMPLRDYATLMMIISDNTGTDVIYRRIGKENISMMLQQMKLKRTKCDLSCDHLVRITYSIPLDLGPREAQAKLFLEDSIVSEVLYRDFDGPNVTSSPKDMVTMFRLIYNHEVASPEACEEMISIMAECQTNTRIPYYLPKRGPNKARIAHKTGSLYAVCNDSGIVMTARRKYILSLFCNGFDATEEEKARYANEHFYDHLLAELSRDVFAAMHAE